MSTIIDIGLTVLGVPEATIEALNSDQPEFSRLMAGWEELKPIAEEMKPLIARAIPILKKMYPDAIQVLPVVETIAMLIEQKVKSP
jgi:hypothetical protein